MRHGWKLLAGILATGGWPLHTQASDPAAVAFEEPAARTPAVTNARLAFSRRQAPAAPGGAADVQAGTPGSPMESPRFNSWFNAYRGFQTGRARLATAESGQAEMATGEITAETAEAPAAEDIFEMGGIPSRQVRGARPGVGRAISSGGAWFNAGSPFGIKYGYGSGFGYGGYGFDNPYGYGSRSGSGGAYGYGFGEYGSVGGQTGERLSSLISGPAEEGGRLIGAEPPGMGAPSRLETAVGGTYGKAGSGARRLGGSASGGRGSGSGGAGD